jgi:spore coat-associated protein N
MTRRLGWASAQRRKLLVSLAVISAAASIAGLGTFATFTSSTSASQSVSSGTVTIALGATGASTNRLTVGASNIAPGDTIQRSVDLMVIDRCSNAWTEGGVAPAYTYTCSGATSTVLASRAIVGSNLTLSNLTALTNGVTDHLRVTLSFPSAAPNSFQNQSSTIQYTFTGTQRAGTNK